MTSRIRRSGLRASRASSHTSAANSGIAYVCARAADGTWMRISGVATAAIHIGEPPRLPRGEHRDAERADEARDVDEVDERQAAEVEEAVRGEMGEPLLVLPRLAAGEGRQAIRVRQAGARDVAAGREPEPRVRGQPGGRDRRAGRARAAAAAAPAADSGSCPPPLA